MADYSVYTEITEDVLDEFIGKNWRKQKHKVLDFSSSSFYLNTLEGRDGGLLNGDLNISYLEKLDVSNNNLQDVSNVLRDSKGFSKLKMLNLHKNFIVECILELSNLIELNLSKNELLKIPVFDFMPSLQIIDLSHNQISGSFAEFEKCANLKVLDISHNQFDMYPSQFEYDIRSLASLSYLQSVDISKNPFTRWFVEYKIICLMKLRNLKFLDGETVDAQAKKQAEEYPLLSYQQYDAIFYERKTLEEAQPQVAKVKQLEFDVSLGSVVELNFLLEEAMSNPDKTVLNAANFYELASHIWDAQVENGYEGLWKNIEDSERARVEASRVMLQNAALLIERSEDARLLVMRGIGKLCVVNEGELGKRSLDLQGKIMTGNIHGSEEVSHIISQTAIPAMQNRALNDPICQTILKGLACMPESIELSDALKELIRQLVELLQEEPTNRDLTAVLAIAVMTEENAVEATGQGAPQIICQALHRIELPVDDRIFNAYLNLLKIVGNCSRFVRKAATYFSKAEIPAVILLPQIRDILGEREETTKMSVMQVRTETVTMSKKLIDT